MPLTEFRHGSTLRTLFGDSMLMAAHAQRGAHVLIHRSTSLGLMRLESERRPQRRAQPNAQQTTKDTGGFSGAAHLKRRAALVKGTRASPAPRRSGPALEETSARHMTRLSHAVTRSCPLLRDSTIRSPAGHKSRASPYVYQAAN